MSFLLCFGRWGKPGIWLNKYHLRCCLGFMAASVTFCDLERLITSPIRKAQGDDVRGEKE